MKTSIYILILFFLLGLSSVANAQVELDPSPKQSTFKTDSWHISVSPYLWLAGLDGNLTLNQHEAGVHQSFGDIFSNLKFGVMGMTEARKGRIGILTDLLFVRVGNQAAIPIQQLPTDLSLKLTTNTFTLTPELAYRIYSNKLLSADILAGFRFYHIGASINVNANQFGQRSYSGGNNWADALGGARVQVRVAPRIGAFLVGDASGGGSSPTWQIATGAGYQLTKHAAVELGYRRLYFSRQNGPNFGLDATQQGLIIGATFALK